MSDAMREAFEKQDKLDAERYRLWRKHYNSEFVLCLPAKSLKFTPTRPQAELFGDDYESMIDKALDEAIRARGKKEPKDVT